MFHHNTRSDGKSIECPQAGAWVRAAFTLVELLVVITIIAILVAILLPAVQRVRASARATQSKSNLSEMGVAMKHYEGLGRGNLRSGNWEQTLSPFLDDAVAIFVDPADDEGDVSYALSSKVVRMGANDDKKIAIVESEERIILLDTESCSGAPLVPNITGGPATRHLGMTNALLYGGAVRSFEPVDIDLTDSTHKPLVVWWLPDREHGMVCGSVVVIDNPNPLPEPSGTEPDSTVTPEPTSSPDPDCLVCGCPDCPTASDTNMIASYLCPDEQVFTGEPGDFTQLTFFDKPPQFTIAVCVRPTEFGNSAHPELLDGVKKENDIFSWGRLSSYWTCEFRLDNGTLLYGEIVHGVYPWKTVDATAPLPLNEWSHVAVTHDGTNIRLYINGELTSSGTSDIPTDFDFGFGHATLGARYRADGSDQKLLWIGSIKRFVVLDRVLTEAEIAALIESP